MDESIEKQDAPVGLERLDKHSDSSLQVDDLPNGSASRPLTLQGKFGTTSGDDDDIKMVY